MSSAGPVTGMLGEAAEHDALGLGMANVVVPSEVKEVQRIDDRTLVDGEAMEDRSVSIPGALELLTEAVGYFGNLEV